MWIKEEKYAYLKQENETNVELKISKPCGLRKQTMAMIKLTIDFSSEWQKEDVKFLFCLTPVMSSVLELVYTLMGARTFILQIYTYDSPYVKETPGIQSAKSHLPATDSALIFHYRSGN